jgi:PAS domain S-box-containing protein/excisionase family DNA binding protein
MDTALGATLASRNAPADGAGEESYYSISESAELLGVSRVTIWRWISAGQLPVRRLGHRTARIARGDLERVRALRSAAGPRSRGSGELGIRAARGSGGVQNGPPDADLAESRECDHFVHFYEADGSLLDAVSDFIGAALHAGDAGVVIATEAHRAGIEDRLRANGVDLVAARADGRYVSLNAAETLFRIMANRAPEPARFVEVVGGIIARAAESGRRVHAFGEMVALLHEEGNHAAVIRLEALWNDLHQEHSFSLMCGYPMGGFRGEAFAESLDDVCAEHSRVIPAESYTSLVDPDDRLRAIAELQQKSLSLQAEIARRKVLEERLREALAFEQRKEWELSDFVETAPFGLQWAGPDGTIMWANRAEVDLLGYTLDEYVGHHIAEFHADPDVIDDILARLLRGETVREYPARLRRKDGSIRHVLIDSSALWEDGEFVHSRCFTRDVTDLWRVEEERARLLERERIAQRQADFLSAASAALAHSLDYEETLDRVAKLAVPDIADWCVVDLGETDGEGRTRLRRIAAAHADRSKEPFIYQLQARFPTVEAESSHTALEVLRSGRPRFDPAVSPSRLQTEARDDEHLALLRALGFSAEMVVPLIAHDLTLGTITFVRGGGRSYDRDDLTVAEELARRCAMAIANVQAFAAKESARREAQVAAERTLRLQEITRLLSQSLEADQVLANIARSAAELLQVTVGAVFLLDRDEPNGDFALSVAHGIDEARLPNLRLPRHASLAGRAVDEGRTVVVDDISGSSGTALPLLLTGETAGSEIAAPITVGTEHLGVVKAFSPMVHHFSPEDSALLSALAAAAAVALTNARHYREAQDAIRMRDEFLSAASHDLKTPLTAVKGTAQLLRRQVTRLEIPGIERLAKGLASIDTTATKMGQQLDELVDVTRVQVGQRLELRRRPIDIVDLARRIIAEQQQVSERHRIHVETSLNELIGTWDGVRLGRVLDNLLSNAIKYSPQGGSITVAIALEDVAGHPWTVIAVRDHGLGIPAVDLPRVFQRFRRARNVEGRIGGTGIGLASARQIVEQHGGTITVESVEGAGSTFTVRLPLAQTAPEEVETSPERGAPPDSDGTSRGCESTMPSAVESVEAP